MKKLSFPTKFLFVKMANLKIIDLKLLKNESGDVSYMGKNVGIRFYLEIFQLMTIKMVTIIKHLTKRTETESNLN